MSVAWKVGDRLEHTSFGEGQVTHVFGRGERVSISVDFEEMGPKILDPQRAPISPVAAAIDDADPVRRPDGQFRWRGALFSTREEMLLAKALMDQGAVAVASNSSLILQRSSKLHRKPDLLVFHLAGGRLIHGIAEVDGNSHDGRWVEDQERHQELQRAGFLAVRHYRAEQVFMDPSGAAADFLGFLESFAALGQQAAGRKSSARRVAM